MAWTNFLDESKKHMGYGTAIPKWKFWIKFPKVATKFYYLEFKYWIKIKLRRYI